MIRKPSAAARGFSSVQSEEGFCLSFFHALVKTNIIEDMEIIHKKAA